MHTSAGHNRRTSKEWLSCWTQDRIDGAYEAEGLPKFGEQKTAKNKANSKGDGATQPIDFDNIDNEAPPEVGDKPHNTELGNSIRFVAEHGATVRYCPDLESWLVWNKKYWQRDDAGLVVELMKRTVKGLFETAKAETDADKRKSLFKFAFESEKARGIHNALNLAKSVPQVVVRVEELDRDHYLFCCANCIIDLRSGAKLEHEPGRLMTRYSSVKYEPDAKSEYLEKWLDFATSSDKEMLTSLIRAAGASMMGHEEKRLWTEGLGQINVRKVACWNAWQLPPNNVIRYLVTSKTLRARQRRPPGVTCSSWRPMRNKH